MNSPDKDETWKQNHHLELKLVGIDHRMNATEEILKEVKNVLVEQNKTIAEMVKIQEKQHIQERDLHNFRKEFTSRNDSIDPILNEFRTTMGKITGIVAATTFFVVIIQGLLGYIITNAFERLDRVERIVLVEKVQK